MEMTDQHSFIPPHSRRLVRLVLCKLPPGYNLRLMHFLAPVSATALAMIILLVRALSRPKLNFEMQLAAIDMIAFLGLLAGVAWGAVMWYAP
jgi:hypothetical protein